MNPLLASTMVLEDVTAAMPIYETAFGSFTPTPTDTMLLTFFSFKLDKLQ